MLAFENTLQNKVKIFYCSLTGVDYVCMFASKMQLLEGGLLKQVNVG